MPSASGKMTQEVKCNFLEEVEKLEYVLCYQPL